MKYDYTHDHLTSVADFQDHKIIEQYKLKNGDFQKTLILSLVKKHKVQVCTSLFRRHQQLKVCAIQHFTI